MLVEKNNYLGKGVHCELLESLSWKPPFMSAIPESEDRLTKAEVEAAFAAFQPADWQRAKIIATTLCVGVTGWTADDLRQEGMCKLLGGERVWPRGIHPLVVLTTVMHSIASNARKHNDISPIDANVVVDPFEAEVDGTTPVAHGKMTVTPEDEILESNKSRASTLRSVVTKTWNCWLSYGQTAFAGWKRVRNLGGTRKSTMRFEIGCCVGSRH